MPSVTELLDRFRGRGGQCTPRHHELQQQAQEAEERARRESARLRMERYNMTAATIRSLYGEAGERLSTGSHISVDDTRPRSTERLQKRRSLNPTDEPNREIQIVEHTSSRSGQQHKYGERSSVPRNSHRRNRNHHTNHVPSGLRSGTQRTIDETRPTTDIPQFPENLNDDAVYSSSDESSPLRNSTSHASTGHVQSQGTAGTENDQGAEEGLEVIEQVDTEAEPQDGPRTNQRKPHSNRGRDRHKKGREKTSRGKSKSRRSKSRERRAMVAIQRFYPHVTESVSNLPELLELIMDLNPDVVLFATRTIRKLLSMEEDAPIKEIVEIGFLPHLIQLLYKDGYPSIQFQAAWALTNVASGTSEFTRQVVDNGGLKGLLRLVSSSHANCCEQAIWAIGNITGDSTDLRDLVIENGVVDAIAECVQNMPPKTSLEKNIAWTLSNLCRGKPPPAILSVAPMLPVLEELLTRSQNVEVLTDGAWALAYLSDGPGERSQVLIDAGVCGLLIHKLLDHESPWVISPALRAVGNVVTGDQAQTQALLNLDVLSILRKLLLTVEHPKLTTEACWAISNITAGSVKQVQSVIDAGITQHLVCHAQSENVSLAKEAVWAIANAVTAGNMSQRKTLVDAGAIEVLAHSITITEWCEQRRFLCVMVDAVSSILAAGVNLDRTPGESVFAKRCRDAGILEKLQSSSFSENGEREVRRRVADVIAKYFDTEEELVMHHPQRPKEVPSHWVNPSEYFQQQSASIATRRAAAREKVTTRKTKVSGTRKLSALSTPPPQFYCSIAQDLMIDPVLTVDGQTYDRYNIQRWFGEGNNSSPATGKDLKSLVLIPNHALRQMIEDFAPGYTWQADLDGDWKCSSCTFLNSASTVVCNSCLLARPHPREEIVQSFQSKYS